MILGLLRVPVTIQHAGSTTSAYTGAAERSWSSPTEVTVYGELQPLRADDERPDTDPAVSRWHLYLPPSTAISHLDRAVVNLTTYEVEGEPFTFYRLGEAQYIRATVKRVA
jgi:hypothetical protein